MRDTYNYASLCTSTGEINSFQNCECIEYEIIGPRRSGKLRPRAAAAAVAAAAVVAETAGAALVVVPARRVKRPHT